MRNTIVFMLVLLLSCAAVRAEPAIIATGDEARMPVVIAGDASKRIKAAANDLAHYLGAMSGATVDVAQQSDGSLSIFGGTVELDEVSKRHNTDGTTGIVLGTLEQFPQDDPAIAEALAIRDGFDGKEAYVIRTTPARILLLGATDLGASHAAYRLLHELGCRWYFPNEAWQVVPQRDMIEVDLTVDDRPAFLSRRIWYGYGYFDRTEGRCRDEYYAWSRRNAMDMSLKIYCGHAWQAIIDEYQVDFDMNPDWYALNDGKRNPESDKFCISNPQLRELVVRYAVQYLYRHEGADMVSLDPSDGGGHCECEKCAAIGGVSERVFMLINEAARAVAEEHPDKLVGSLAYNLHSEPPSFNLEPNVYIQLTAGFIRGRYTYDELLDLWPQKASNMGYYDYYSVYLWDWDMPPGGRGANVDYITKRIRRYADGGGTSIDCESGNNWGLHGRGYYLANRLMWNPDADADAILHEFYTGAFGPAADVMQRYYERIDPGNKPLMSTHLIALALRDLEEATTLAVDRPDVLARLDQLKSYWRYVHLRWQLNRTQDAAQREALTLAALTHVYRDRYFYMNHWEAMRQSWTRKAAEEFEQPTWSFKDRGPHPWQVDEPYTQAERDAYFREALDAFEPQPFEQLTFSDDLRPVMFDGARPAATHQRYQGRMPIVMYSLQGEPLSVTVTTGTIVGYRDRADARYTWRDADGNELSSGKLPLDGEEHELTLKPPKPGLYHLDFNDSGAGWAFKADPQQILSIRPQRATTHRHAGWMQAIYFYVPKGTQQIVYFWEGNEHRVHGPDGAVLQKVDTSGGFVTVDVPPGMDGKPWKFSQMAMGEIWFFNAPNVFAASPQSLLLPQELIVKDDLRVRR